MANADVPDWVYARLLAIRSELRRFYRWNEDEAASVGLTQTQHQLLLAIRGHGDPRGPTISEVADYLYIQQHSAVGLVDRAVALQFVSRHHDDDDRRLVHLRLTRLGKDLLERLSGPHLEELARFAPRLFSLWQSLASEDRTPEAV